MKSNFKMKEATNKQEAIKSILYTIEQNPIFLNKCKSNMIPILKTISEDNRAFWLDCLDFNEVRNIYIDIKAEYYNFKDITQYNY